MADGGLVQTLRQAPHTFLQPSPDVSADALALAKELLDPLAQDIAQAQILRRDQNRKKRKRGDDEPQEQILQLRTVYTKGLAVRQVWEQARRILDAACNEIERSLPRGELDGPAQNNVSDEEEADGLLDGDDGTDSIVDSEEDVDDDEVGEDEEMASEENEEEEEEDIEALEDEDLPEDLSDDVGGPEETWQQDKHGLNDAFFSIDDFNRQSQFLEQMDARGDDDNPSDEDEIDWDADPLTQPIPTSSATKRNAEFKKNDSEDDDDDEAGPTFGNADLNAPDSDEDGDEDDDEGYLDDAMPGLNNTNDIRYKDFFEPPPKKLSKTKRMRALPKTQPPKASATGDLDEDTQRAMNDVNRDIFASESEEDDQSDSDASNPRSRNMSTHEKQRAKIATEIRRLEAANVAKRDWTLSGEARAAERPINSLIEEDLEFERIGKPVPVITAETSEEIEQLIKRRIIARDFDEVLRRHPDTLNAPDQRRGRIELDDTKPQSGLAEVYEQDHLKSTDPNYTDARSKQTKKQHDEIARLWKEVSNQLDLLSNLHFKPKRVEAEIKVVEDKPRIAMEDARPTGEGTGEESMLAPQEVYRAGEKKAAGEVVRKSGAAVSKEEMSREEKKRKRRREKERAKKGKVGQGATPVTSGKDDKKSKKKGSKEDQQNILEELKRGGVKVVDKKGELQSLSRKGQGRGGADVSSSALKL